MLYIPELKKHTTKADKEAKHESASKRKVQEIDDDEEANHRDNWPVYSKT